MEILERIDELRVKRGWTFYQLAENAELPQSTVANMFARKTYPSIATLEKICSAFGISMAEFFADEHELEKDKSSYATCLFNKLSVEDQKAIIQILKSITK